MPNHLLPKLTIAALCVALAVPVSAQVAPAATGGGGLTLAAGGGVSNYKMDYGRGREWGGTLWVDGNPNIGPSYLQGLGLELEARDLSLDRGSGLPNDMRTDTLGGGVKYSWRHFHNFRPYVKMMVSYGSLDLTKHGYHWTWTEYGPGGGIEYRALGRLWLRADYEYQAWFAIFGKSYNFDPQGFTVGAVYDFGHPHFHH